MACDGKWEWVLDKSSSPALLSHRPFLLGVPTALLLLLLYFSSFSSYPFEKPSFPTAATLPTPDPGFSTRIPNFDCRTSPQASPVFASVVEGVRYPFLYSIADLGSLPDNPNDNILRVVRGQPFDTPDISVPIQEVLEQIGVRPGVVVDVGGNVGMATFAAAAMGRRVLAFEPVFENLQRLCDGVFLNRVWDRVTLFAAVASDHFGNVTIHKLVGRLDNTAISATGAKMSFPSSQEIVAAEVPSTPLDAVIPDSEEVVLLKIDVQGWEYHVLKGAEKLLSRGPGRAPFLMYEEDERLLQASNTTAQEIRHFLASVGYNSCTRHGGDAHCTKE